MKVPLQENPVDRIDGTTPTVEKFADGQYKNYWVLDELELSQKFVRPFRAAYVHSTCKTATRCGETIGKTFARDPHFYSHTFCVHCAEHFPVSEFTWQGTNELVGS